MADQPDNTIPFKIDSKIGQKTPLHEIFEKVGELEITLLETQALFRALCVLDDNSHDVRYALFESIEGRLKKIISRRDIIFQNIGGHVS